MRRWGLDRWVGGKCMSYEGYDHRISFQGTCKSHKDWFAVQMYEKMMQFHSSNMCDDLFLPPGYTSIPRSFHTVFSPTPITIRLNPASPTQPLLKHRDRTMRYINPTKSTTPHLSLPLRKAPLFSSAPPPTPTAKETSSTHAPSKHSRQAEVAFLGNKTRLQYPHNIRTNISIITPRRADD